MKRILCLIFAIVFAVTLFGCKSKSTETVEVVYEDNESTSSENNSSNTVSDNTSSDDTPSQDDASSSQPSTSSGDATSQPTVSTPGNNETQESIYQLSDAKVMEKIKLNGRCEQSHRGINLNLAASAIEFNTDSSSVMFEVYASTGLYYTIMVDGKIKVQHEAIENYGTNYISIRDFGEGSHNIKFIRDSESRTDLGFTVVNIQLDDGTTLLAKDGDKKLIEFLGDSLTSGYGNIVINGTSEPQSLENQSSVKAYPFLLANKLGYDYRIVSMSGIALGKREGYPSFPEFYNLESYHIDKTKKYTSSNPSDVDIVVINLGTNDVGSTPTMYDAKNPESVDAYIQNFVNLVTGIGYRKDAKIVFVSGVWYKEPITAINAAVTELKSLGYDSIYTLELPEYKSGGGSHPSDKEHQEIAEKLAKLFKDNGI